MTTWIGPVPQQCDLCRAPFITTFYDAATRQGPWANMCPQCFSTYGVKLGQGYGQQYQLQGDGKWHKIAG